jgi:20S proteasome alpha/beta subunit
MERQHRHEVLGTIDYWRRCKGALMTLVIGVATGDGLVLAADSRTTQALVDKPWRVLSDFTNKVFEVGRFAAATAGWAFLSGRNVAAHMSEFVQSFEELTKTPEDVAHELATYFERLFNEDIAAGFDDAPPAGTSVLELYVAGYSGAIGETWQISIPGPTIAKRYTTELGGALWQGQIDVVGRLIKGIDPTLVSRIAGDPSLISALSSLEPAIDGLEYMLNLRLMNIQDAIDLAVLLIRTTIEVQRLTNGVVAEPGAFPGVGGPVQIALVTANGGFEWVQRTAILGERPSGRAEDL